MLINGKSKVPIFFFNQAYPKIELKISTKYSNHEDSKYRKSGLDANETSDIIG